MRNLLILPIVTGICFGGLIVGTAETSGMDPFCAN